MRDEERYNRGPQKIKIFWGEETQQSGKVFPQKEKLMSDVSVDEAQRSKKSRNSESPKIFSGTARGAAQQLKIPPSPPKNNRHFDTTEWRLFYT